MDHWSILLAYSAYPVIHPALAPRIRFYLHKEFRGAGIRILSTQRWGDVDEYMKFSGGDLVQNGSFQRVKLANVGGFSDFLWGVVDEYRDAKFKFHFFNIKF